MTEIESLTIKEAKEKLEQYKQLKTLFNIDDTKESINTGINNDYIGQKVIVRTYSAGVWFGTVTKKSGNEIILSKARRMYYWKAKQSISLSAVAKYGIESSSRICPIVENVWLQPIELIECTTDCINSIEQASETDQN